MATKPFQLHVQEPWFTEIASGRKTVEGRAGQAGKYDHLVGSQIDVLGPELSVRATVVGVRHFPTLDSYIAAEGWERIAPQSGSDSAAKKAYAAVAARRGGAVFRVFAPQRVAARGGMNAVELELCRRFCSCVRLGREQAKPPAASENVDGPHRGGRPIGARRKAGFGLAPPSDGEPAFSLFAGAPGWSSWVQDAPAP